MSNTGVRRPAALQSGGCMDASQCCEQQFVSAYINILLFRRRATSLRCRSCQVSCGSLAMPPKLCADGQPACAAAVPVQGLRSHLRPPGRPAVACQVCTEGTGCTKILLQAGQLVAARPWSAVLRACKVEKRSNLLDRLLPPVPGLLRAPRSLLLSHLLRRMVILGTGMTALLCKPMFAVCGLVRGMAGTQACVQWVTTAKASRAGWGMLGGCGRVASHLGGDRTCSSRAASSLSVAEQAGCCTPSTDRLWTARSRACARRPPRPWWASWRLRAATRRRPHSACARCASAAEWQLTCRNATAALPHSVHKQALHPQSVASKPCL